MPTWGEILQELNTTRLPNNQPNFDGVRRKYLTALYAHTGRNAILYATKFTQGGVASPEDLAINDEDLQGLMEVVNGLAGPDLDLILHTPGGQVSAAEAFVVYLRSKFSHIRVVIPQAAMSAGTLIACAADRVLMGKHSSLGPIDPQVVIDTPLGRRMVPAEAIVDQFELAKKECSDTTKLAAWLPMLGQYGPDLLVQCGNASKLSRSLAQGWLEKYMLKTIKNSRSRKRKAKQIAAWLAAHRRFMTHSRHLSRDTLEAKGMAIDYLEADQIAQDLFLSVFHATTHTFSGTGAVKIIENHMGRAFVKQQQRIAIPQVAVVPLPGPGPGP